MILQGQELVDKAREFAERAHAQQFRKDGKTPYIEHPKDVARRCVEMNFPADPSWGIDVSFLQRGEAVAWLHDTMESDCKNTVKRADFIDAGFPNEVVADVEMLTHENSDSYLEYILTLKHPFNWVSRLVKLADIESNLATIQSVPDAGARKGLRAKWEMARYILNH